MDGYFKEWSWIRDEAFSKPRLPTDETRTREIGAGPRILDAMMHEPLVRLHATSDRH
jgi:hypothetical protein